MAASPAPSSERLPDPAVPIYALTPVAPQRHKGLSPTLLAYAMAHLKPARTASQIASWTRWYESLTPSDPDARAFFNDVHRRNAPLRSDISTWFDWLELDDYVTYGGKP